MIGLSSSLVKGGMTGRTYVKDGLKLYMPYRGSDASEVKFVGTGSTSFNGSSDYIDTGLTGLTVHTNATMSYWCKMGDFTGAQTMGAHAGKRFYLGFLDEKAWFGIQNQYKDTTSISSYIATNTWIHLCLVAKDGTATYYLNGIARDTNTYTQSSDSNPVGFFIGGVTNPEMSYPMNGNIKNVAIWERALTATEVQNVMYKTYAEVSGRLADGLVSWWALDADSLGSELILGDDSDMNTVGNWSIVGSASGTITGGYDSTDVGHDKTLRFEAGDQWNEVVWLDIAYFRENIVAGQTYRIQFDYKWINAPNSINGTSLGGVDFAVTDVTASGWTEYDSTNTVINNTSVLSIILNKATGGSASNEILIDNVSVKEVQVEDLKGSNDGSIFGATVDEDLYGGDTPVIPRAIDNARTVQADAIGAGSALFDGDYLMNLLLVKYLIMKLII